MSLLMGFGGTGTTLVRMLRTLYHLNENITHYRGVDTDSNNHFHEERIVHQINIDHLWTGGAGSNHVIGGLIADAIIKERVLEQNIPTGTPCILTMSTGGGTGGGCGSEVAERLASQRPVVQIAIMPESIEDLTPGVIYPVQDGALDQALQINAADELIANATGRLFLRWMNNAILSENQNIDLCLFSNSYLLQHDQVPIKKAIEKINHHICFITKAVQESLDANNWVPSRSLVTSGFAIASTENQSPDSLSKNLVKKCFMPINFEEEIPSGMSISPLPIDMRIDQHIDELLLSETHDNDLKTSLSSSDSVKFYITTSCENLRQAERNILLRQISIDLQRLYGTAVPVDFGGFLPMPIPNGHIGLILFQKNLFCEQMWRLFNFHLQFCWPWKTQQNLRHQESLNREISLLISNLITHPQATEPNFVRTVLLGQSQEDAFTNLPFLLENATEQYPTHLYGSFKFLCDAIVQSAELPSNAEQQHLMTLSHLINSFVWLARRIQSYRQNMPAGAEDWF